MQPSVARPKAGPAPIDSIAGDVHYYLTLTPRQLPSRYFYDALGSALFEAICEQPWDPITRTERALLARHGRAIFAPVPGFQPMASYPEYSADFFDGEHFVITGASPATARELIRPSFRNWFRPRYPYVYAAFRCVQIPA